MKRAVKIFPANTHGMSEQFSTADILERFIDHLRDGRKLAPTTVEGYGHDVSLFIGFLNTQSGSAPKLETLESVKPRTVRSWLATRRDDGLEAATSRSRAMSSLKAFYRYLQNQYGLENPSIMAMSGPKKPERLPRPTSEKDTKKLLDLAGQVSDEPWVQARDVALLTLLYAAGLRISEALSLTGADTPAPETLRILGKRNKVRLVPLIPVARESLDAYSLLCPYHLSDSTPFFYGVRGGPLSPRIAQKLMQHLRGALGLADSATPHALRHAFASHLLAHGGDLRSIQGLMGHESPSTTQVYLGIEEARLTAAHKSAHPRA